MNGEVGRREFLGSAAIVGVGSMTGGPLLVKGARTDVHHTASHVEQELREQLRAGVRGLRGPRPGESARKVASTLRLAAAHCKETGMDEDLKAFLRSTIQREGRTSLLNREVDKHMLAAEMREFGVIVPVDFGQADYEVREQTLDLLLGMGLTPLMIRVADTLDRRSEKLDTRGAFTFTSAQDEQPKCPDTTDLERLMDMTLMVACVFMPLACFIVSGMWFGLQLSLFVAC